MKPVIRIAAASDVGCVRKNNEDSYKYMEEGDDFWAAVADGCGGELAGEVASRMAVELFAQEVDRHRTSPRDIVFILRDAVVKANRSILEAAQQVDKRGMGTTFSGIYIRGKNLFTLHAGDSRIYRKRDGRFEQLTEDHTWVQEQVKRGKMSQEEADNHPRSGVLMRALGTPDFTAPDIDFLDARSGDTILISSDGLHRVVTLEEISDAMDLDQEETARTLIEKALKRGSPDNVTVIALKVVEAS